MWRTTTYTSDPVADAERYYNEQDDYYRRLPSCAYCGQKITDKTCFQLEGETICTSCMDDSYLVDVEELMD